MGEGLRQRRYHQEEDDEELFESDSYSSNSDADDCKQDVTGSPPASSSPSSKPASDGPLHEMSSLVEQLPIKRGLSKYYQGKSQSFTSLAVVSSIEDLPKKETPYARKMKTCRSYAGGMDASQKQTKKAPRVVSCASLMSRSSSRGSPPSIPLQNTSCPR
ncbi:hypothetical protein OPV22_006872 [Ensete ventricosum]|uniref:Oxidative stress 3 n=1 Tax=Ensete ventricosum TaxID=4639 RepID=A0AAV8RLR3_ENSVE|nr:hypothetical protein OPV22_006872 [Ensete ventricosum]